MKILFHKKEFRSFKHLMLVFLLIFSFLIPTALTGCGSRDTAEEAFTEDLVPLSEEELEELQSETDSAITEDDADITEDDAGTVSETSEKSTQEGKKKKSQKETNTETLDETAEIRVEEDGVYTSRDEVALYIHTFEHLPDNYITKNEAKDLGWVSREGNLDEVAPGMSIGGDYFGNYEELLPVKKGRKYYECDIDYEGGYRNEKRIIFSNDGLIYYTEDHYESFEQLY